MLPLKFIFFVLYIHLLRVDLLFFFLVVVVDSFISVM